MLDYTVTGQAAIVHDTKQIKYRTEYLCINVTGIGDLLWINVVNRYQELGEHWRRLLWVLDTCGLLLFLTWLYSNWALCSLFTSFHMYLSLLGDFSSLKWSISGSYDLNLTYSQDKWQSSPRHRASLPSLWTPFQYKGRLFRQVDSRCKDMTIGRSYYLYDMNPHTIKTASLYWYGPFIPQAILPPLPLFWGLLNLKRIGPIHWSYLSWCLLGCPSVWPILFQVCFCLESWKNKITIPTDILSILHFLRHLSHQQQTPSTWQTLSIPSSPGYPERLSCWFGNMMSYTRNLRSNENHINAIKPNSDDLHHVIRQPPWKLHDVYNTRMAET